MAKFEKAVRAVTAVTGSQATDPILLGLPALADLEKADGAADTFAALRTWATETLKHDQLAHAGRILRLDHRCAVLSFLRKQSECGIRQNRARMLLATFSAMEEWTRSDDDDFSEPDIHPQGTPDPLVDGIPSQARLESQDGIPDTFANIRTWVKDTAARGDLARAARHVAPEHKRAIFDFLRQQASAGMRQSRAKEVLAKLSSVEEWARDGFSAEAGARKSAGASHSEVAAEVAREVLVAATVVKAMKGQLPLAQSDDVAGEHVRNQEGSDAAEAETEAEGGETFQIHLPQIVEPLEAHVPQIVLPSTDGGQSAGAVVPSQFEIEDQSSDDRVIFSKLRRWVQAQHTAGNLAEAGESIELSHRRSIFSLLHAYPKRRPAAREQAIELLQWLGALESWHRGLDDSILVLRDIVESRLAVSEECSPRSATGAGAFKIASGERTRRPSTGSAGGS